MKFLHVAAGKLLLTRLPNPSLSLLLIFELQYLSLVQISTIASAWVTPCKALLFCLPPFHLMPTQMPCRPHPGEALQWPFPGQPCCLLRAVSHRVNHALDPLAWMEWSGDKAIAGDLGLSPSVATITAMDVKIRSL